MKIQFNVKIEEKDLKLAQKIATSRGGDVSDLIRLSLRKELARLGFLGSEDMKALEVIEN